MARLFIGTGYELLNKTTLAARDAATACQWDTIPTTELQDLVESKYQASRTLMIHSDSPELSSNSPEPGWFFGSGADRAILGRMPKPVERHVDHPSIRGTLSRKAFHRQRLAGKIVLQPFQEIEQSMILTPGFLKDDLRKPTVLRRRRAQYGAFPTGKSGSCGDRYGVKWLHDGESYTDVTIQPTCLHNVSHVIDYYSNEANNIIWRMPSEFVGTQLAHAVTAGLHESVNSGLVTEILAEANAGTFDLLTNVAESKEAVQTIMKLVMEAVTLYSETRRKVFTIRSKAQKGQNVVSEVANRWLEFRYGVMPILYSVQDMIDYLNGGIVSYQTYRGGREIVGDKIVHGDWSGDPPPIIHRCFLKRRFNALVNTGNFMKMNIASTAWELVPLSFVIDWFINVGDFLTALQTPSGVDEQGVFYSTQLRDSKIVFTNPNLVGASITISTSGYRGSPINPLANVGINFNPVLTSKRWLDALALSWGNVRRLIR